MSTRAKKIITGFVAGALAAILLTVAVPNAQAQSPAEFFKGKNVTIVVGFDPGSDFDVKARMMVPYLTSAMGVRSIAVEDRPGAAQITATNQLYTTKPDGLTVMLSHGPRLVFNAAFGAQGVAYDWKKFVWLGKLLEENMVIFVSKKVPWKTPQDLAGQKIIMGTSRPFYEPLFAEALGWDELQLVPGFNSVAERIAAMDRGELQATAANASFFGDTNTVTPIVITLKHKRFPNVPTVRQVASKDKEKWVSALESLQKIQYTFVAPPELPDDRAKFWEDSLRKVYGNADFQKKVDSLQLDMADEFVGSKELRDMSHKLADDSFKSADDAKNFQNVIERKYVKK
jgi:tripartite-type tricarboxylate transporter receptor subunit TctC